jgi:hypothetical protein
MAVSKRVLRPDRLRRVPSQFSWVDHRLVRDGHISRCPADALALYLLLVTVADSQGLSYYCDTTLCRLLPLDAAALSRARQELIANQLIAYARPLYQVLALPALGPSRSQSPAPSQPPPQPPPPQPQPPPPQPAHPQPSSRPSQPRPSQSRPLSSRRGAGDEPPACPHSIAQILQRMMENAKP